MSDQRQQQQLQHETRPANVLEAFKSFRSFNKTEYFRSWIIEGRLSSSFVKAICQMDGCVLFLAAVVVESDQSLQQESSDVSLSDRIIPSLSSEQALCAEQSFHPGAACLQEDRRCGRKFHLQPNQDDSEAQSIHSSTQKLFRNAANPNSGVRTGWPGSTHTPLTHTCCTFWEAPLRLLLITGPHS